MADRIIVTADREQQLNARLYEKGNGAQLGLTFVEEKVYMQQYHLFN